MPERKRKVQIGHLDTLAGILQEAGRVYRQCRRKEIDDVHAVRLVSILREMRAILEIAEIEKRLDALEDNNKVAPLRRVS